MSVQLLPEYKPLFTPPRSRYFLLTGGRGSAKSFHVTYFLLWLMHEPGHTILFTRWTMTSAHISIIPEFNEKIEMLGKSAEFEVTKTDITYVPTGSKILFRGIKTSQGTATANLKSIPGLTTWVIEEAEELQDEKIFDTIDLSVRTKGMSNRVMILMNPAYKSHFIFKRFLANGKRPDTTYIHTTYLCNLRNLDESFVQKAESLKEINPVRYGHLFLGDWLEDKEGLLWNRAMIERCRIDKAPEVFIRKVVAVDPAITANLDSDETGIIVLGLGQNRTVYVLADYSGRYSPSTWAKVVADAVKIHDCDCIVGEKNQGGDMVKTVIRTHDKSTRVKLVSATRGKYVRAEPVFSLYEEGRVFHVGELPLLENQMIHFEPEKGTSPDRVDALVWGVTELSVKKAREAFLVSDGQIIREIEEDEGEAKKSTKKQPGELPDFETFEDDYLFDL